MPIALSGTSEPLATQELTGHNAVPFRLVHTMLRVADLERALLFYSETLGMRLLRQEHYPSGRFTLAFLGYADERTGAQIELTHNWDKQDYPHGGAFGHIALAVANTEAACARLAAMGVKILRAPGPMSNASAERADAEVIAFIEDPDGYRIELIETQP